MLLKHVGIVMIGLAVPMAACWACSPQPGDGVRDAETDTLGQGDTKRGDGNAPRDASNEVTSDAETQWLTGDWDPVSCPGTGCTEYIARDPVASVGALKWKTCASGRAGCEELVVDWTPYKGRALGVSTKQPVVVASDGTPYLLLSKFYPEKDYDASRRTIAAIYPMAKAPVFAMAKTLVANDVLSWLLIGNSGVVHGLASRSARIQVYLTSTWDAPSVFVQAQISYADLGVAGNGTPGYGIPNAQRLFQLLQPLGQRLVDITGGSSAPVGTTLDGPLAVPSGFVGLRFSAGLPLTFVANNGTVATLHAAPANRTLSGFAIDQGQTRLVWAESADVAPASDSVLYEAPFAETEAGIVPHRVTAFDDPGGRGGGYMIAHNGTAVLLVSDTRVLITNLATGASWPIDADPGKNFFDPIWVDDNEIWLSVGTIRGNGADFDSIHRITRASLGPPSIPPK